MVTHLACLQYSLLKSTPNHRGISCYVCTNSSISDVVCCLADISFFSFTKQVLNKDSRTHQRVFPALAAGLKQAFSENQKHRSAAQCSSRFCLCSPLPTNALTACWGPSVRLCQAICFSPGVLQDLLRCWNGV